jgi:hypothetical protein
LEDWRWVVTGPVVHEEQGLGFYFLYIGQHLGDFEQANVVVLFNFFFFKPSDGYEVSVLQRERSYGDRWWWWLPSIGNVLKAPELHT